MPLRPHCRWSPQGEALATPASPHLVAEAGGTSQSVPTTQSPPGPWGPAPHDRRGSRLSLTGAHSGRTGRRHPEPWAGSARPGGDPSQVMQGHPPRSPCRPPAWCIPEAHPLPTGGAEPETSHNLTSDYIPGPWSWVFKYFKPKPRLPVPASCSRHAAGLAHRREEEGE